MNWLMEVNDIASVILEMSDAAINHMVSDDGLSGKSVKGKLSHDDGWVLGGIEFTFEGDTAFIVQNQMVYGYTQQGTSFVRYPTTFHDVVIDGQRMSAPSELKIYKAFGISGAVPKDKEE